MLSKNTPLTVHVRRFRGRVSTEGQKLAVLGLRYIVDGTKGAVGAIADAARLMKDQQTVGPISVDEEMKGMRLELQAGTGRGPAQIVAVTDLRDFQVSRETATQSGTLKKEKSGRLTVDFSFAAPLVEIGHWATDNYGDDVTMTIAKAQGELDLQEPDSQASRNKRIVDGEKADRKGKKRAKRDKGVSDGAQGAAV